MTPTKIPALGQMAWGELGDRTQTHTTNKQMTWGVGRQEMWEKRRRGLGAGGAGGMHF